MLKKYWCLIIRNVQRLSCPDIGLQPKIKNNMTNQEKQVIRYSFSFKQLVVNEIESGGSIAAVARKYDIKGGATIKGWILKLGKTHLLNKIVRVETTQERDKVKALEAEVNKLKLRLADSILAQQCMETLIELANKEYKTDIKKNFGLKQ